MIDDELQSASDDLRRAVNNVATPPFEAARRSTEQDRPVSITDAPSKRRIFSTRILAVAASVALVAIGTITALRFSEGQETNAGTPDGETNPTNESADTTAAPADTSWLNGVSGTQELEEKELTEPEPGQTVLDPTFGTTVRSVGNNSKSSSLMPLQVRPAWNVDGSRLLMYRSGSGFSLFDAETLTELRVLPISPTDIEQVYWHPRDSALLYFFDNTDSGAVQLKSFDVETSSASTVYTYEGCNEVTGGDSFRISAETLFIGQLCMSDEGAFVVSVNVVSGKTIRQPAGDFGAPQPTPSSGRYVVRTVDGDTRVLDNQLQSTGVEFVTGDDPMVIIETAQGQELLVTTIYSADDDQVGSVVAFDLADGSSTVVVGPATGYPYPPSVGGMATSVVNDGRVVFATSWDPALGTLTGEIMTIDFDQPSPVVKRVAHHRSTTRNATDRTWSEPHPSLHPRLPAVAFTSNWNGAHSSPFIVSD